MRVSLAEIQKYAKTLESLSDAAAQRVDAAIALWMTEHPDASVAECRELAIAVVRDALQRYGDAAATQAAKLYDDVMTAEGVDVPSAQIYDGPDDGAIRGTIHRHAGKLVGDVPDLQGFRKGVKTLVHDSVRRAANDTVVQNVARDSKTRKGSGVRFARVPQRPDPCPYCVMLASRGFVYVSRETANASSHHNCTCILVPGMQGKTRIDGYDPDTYYKQYAQLMRDPDFEYNMRQSAERATGNRVSWTG